MIFNQSIIRSHIKSSIDVKLAILDDQEAISQIEILANACLSSLRQGGKIIFAGNGGSFSDAQHLAAEFVSRFLFDRAPLASIVLGVNSSTLSAIANDYGYEKVFMRELKSLARPGDVFIPISTSGNSLNVLAATSVAKDLGLTIVGLTGKAGGKLKSLCSCISVPSDDTAHIQESHIVIGHILCGLVEKMYFHGDL